jgi:hypothetical protein
MTDRQNPGHSVAGVSVAGVSVAAVSVAGVLVAVVRRFEVCVIDCCDWCSRQAIAACPQGKEGID